MNIFVSVVHSFIHFSLKIEVAVDFFYYFFFLSHWLFFLEVEVKRTRILYGMATTSAAEGSSEYIETLQDKGTCTQLASIFQQDVHIIPEETLRKISQGSMKSFILESKEYT